MTPEKKIKLIKEVLEKDWLKPSEIIADITYICSIPQHEVSKQ